VSLNRPTPKLRLLSVGCPISIGSSAVSDPCNPKAQEAGPAAPAIEEISPAISCVYFEFLKPGSTERSGGIQQAAANSARFRLRLRASASAGRSRRLLILMKWSASSSAKLPRRLRSIDFAEAKESDRKSLNGSRADSSGSIRRRAQENATSKRPQIAEIFGLPWRLRN